MEAKGLLRQAKDDTVQEYHDSNALLKELGGSFANGFDNCFHQVKASFSDLNLSHISIDVQAQTPAQPVYSEGIDKLFAEKPTPTLKLTGVLLMLIKKNPLGMVPVNLKGIRRLRKMKNLPLASSSSFFFSFSFLYIVNFVFLRKQYLFLPSPIVSWFLWM